MTIGDKLQQYDPTVSGSVDIDPVDGSGQFTLLTLDDSAWTKVERSGSTDPTGSGPLTNRRALCIQNQSNFEIKLNYADIGGGNYKGITISAGAERHYQITGAVDVYLLPIPGSGNPVIGYEELRNA